MGSSLINEDMHTKPLRSSDFAHMALKILGQPAPLTPPTHITPTLPVENMSVSDMDARSQPSTERKRSWLPTETNASAGAKRRKEHHLSRFLTRPALDSTMDADVNVPALRS